MATLIHPDGNREEVFPQFGDKFTLEELQSFVGGLIEVIPRHPDGRHKGYTHLCNEEGLIYGLPKNEKASSSVGMTILGNVLKLSNEEWQ
tara:strand:- start:438 stop:707 length:270 start_codon:yes stop_codon:yes gene_type:complete